MPPLLRERIEALSMFGRPAGGTFADGVSRVAYSDADVAGRQLRHRPDARGRTRAAHRRGRQHLRAGARAPNRRCRRSCSDRTSTPSRAAATSTATSVARGDRRDRSARLARNVRTRHPLEMVVWSAEEGVAFGRGLAASRIVAGDVKPADMDAVWNGLRRGDAHPEDRRQSGSHHGRRAAEGRASRYLELHIEQGGTLERDRIAIGVVEGIVAIERYSAVVTGFANHAGTTPMAERQDALIAASQLTLAVREAVNARPGRQVGTVGQLNVEPNAPNVIPGVVRMTIELRDLSADEARRARRRHPAARRRDRRRRRRRRSRSPSSAAIRRRSPPKRCSARSSAPRRRWACPTRRQPSGAGHDAQMMAQLGPMGMIFVPSVGGISHSPRELTTWEDCANGANVLLGAVFSADVI